MEEGRGADAGVAGAGFEDIEDDVDTCIDDCFAVENIGEGDGAVVKEELGSYIGQGDLEGLVLAEPGEGWGGYGRCDDDRGVERSWVLGDWVFHVWVLLF